MPGLTLSAGIFLLFSAGLWLAASGRAGPDPAKWLLHQSGFVALCLLVITIAMASLRRALAMPWLLRWRRAFGLAAFVVASAHVTIYVALYQALDFSAIGDDVVKRPYIIIGLAAWLLLVPLALTSTARMRRGMGAHWYALHRLVYVAVAFAIVHQGMAQKADLAVTLAFVALFAVLLAEKFVLRRVVRAPGA